MDEHEGVDSVATTETVPASEGTLMGNSEQAEGPCGEGDESDIMVEIKGSDVFVDGVRGDGDSLNKVDSESKTEDLDGGGDFGAKDVQNDTHLSGEVLEGKTETGVEDIQDARDVAEMECAEAISEKTDVAKEVRDEDTEKGVEGGELSGLKLAGGSAAPGELASIGVESDVLVWNPGIETVREPESKSSPVPREETSFKDEALHGSVTDAALSSSENGQGLANPTVCQGVDKDCSGNRSDKIADCPTGSNNSLSQFASEDAALMPREEETSFKDEAMHDPVTDLGVSSSEKDQGLVNPTVFKKVDVDCSGHDSNKISDGPSEPKSSPSQIVREDTALMPREEDTKFKDKDLHDFVADAGISSLENDQSLVNPTICQEIDKDYSGHATDKISDCPAEAVTGVEIGMVNEDEIIHSKVEPMENIVDNKNLPHYEEGLQAHGEKRTAIHDTVVADSQSFDELADASDGFGVQEVASKGFVDPKCEVHNKAESEKSSGDHVPEAPTSADNNVKDNSEVLPDLQPSTESGNDNINHDDLELSHAKYNNLEKGEVREMKVEGVLDSKTRTSSIHRSENDISLETSNNIVYPADSGYADAMDIHEDKLDVTNTTNVSSTKDSDVVQTDAMVIDEDKLEVTNATNLGSTKDSDVVQTDSKLSVKHTVVVPGSTQVIDNKMLANSAFEGLDGHGSVPKDDENVDLVNKGNQAGNECTTDTEVGDDQIAVNSTFEFIDDGFWQEDEGRNAIVRGDQAKSEGTTDAGAVQSHDHTGTQESLVECQHSVTLEDGNFLHGSLPSSSKDEDLKAETVNMTLAEDDVVQSDTTPGTDIEICNQMSTQSTCTSKEGVVMQQNLVLTPEVDHGQSMVMKTVAEGQVEGNGAGISDVEGATGTGTIINSDGGDLLLHKYQPVGTDVSRVGAYNEVIDQVIEMENALLKTNDDCFLDAHAPETMVIDEQREEESEKLYSDVEHDLGLEQREIQENASQTDQTLVSHMKAAKPVNIANICPGFLLPPEKSGKFTVSDLVWGKVRSHPWWPGQIFDPADASEKAVRYYKKGCFLVAYFGDRTFAWNDASVLKPFWSQFSQIEKQSNSETFQNAVRCALEEVSRRIELGLACSCIPKSSYNKIACQIIENTGIREESSRRYGVDKSTGVKSFAPNKLLQFLRGMARSPTCGADRLDLVIARAQLLAYSHFKGYGELSEFLLSGELLENEDEGVLMNKFPSHKRKHNLKDSLQPMKKERRMSEIMGGSELEDSLADGSDSTKSVYAAKVSSTTSVAPNPPFMVGERILRAASHLKGDSIQPEASAPSQNPPREKVVIPTELPSMDELFSQLQLVARAPMGDHSFLNTFIHFILDLRYPKHSELQNSSAGRPVGGRKRRASQAADGSTEDFEFDDINDSYWTDRIVQNYSEEQLLQNGETGREEYQLSAFDSDKSHKANRRSYSRKRYSIGNNDMGVDECSEDVEKRKHEPAELILNFAEGNRLPSEMNLNKIFRRFGPLKELETEVHPECARARVVFKRGSDAEVAYSSAGKFNIFGSMHVNYELNYTPVISVRPLLLTIPQGQEEAI